MGADQEIDVALGEPCQQGGALAPALAAGENGDPDAGGVGQRRDRLEMLAGKDFGRRHHGRLSAGRNRRRASKQRHHGLSGADVALQQAQHSLGPGEIAGDVGYGGLLARGQGKGQGGGEFGLK